MNHTLEVARVLGHPPRSILFENRKVDQWGNVVVVERDTQDLAPGAGFTLDCCGQPTITRVRYAMTEAGLLISSDVLLYLDRPHEGEPVYLPIDVESRRPVPR